MNILLWGCEYWALTAEDRRKLEVFHSWCCQRMLNITIYDVMANHKLTNKKLLKELGICNMSTYLKLRRSRWLGKLSHMNNKRISHLLLGSWIPKARRNGKAGRAQQTSRHAYACTYKN